MENKEIVIEGKVIPLVKVAENGENVLYKYETDERICGAPISEVKEKFPDYKIGGMEMAFCDFLIEENGTMVVYEPDGSVADPFEVISNEEIDKTE